MTKTPDLMIRVFKFILKLFLALLAVGLTFLLIFLILPSWQKAVVEKVLAADSQRKWQLESIELGMNSVQATQVYMLDGPVGAEASKFSLSGPIWKIPLTGSIRVKSGNVDGFYVDVSQLRVGDVTSEDWQSFLEKVSSDVNFWEERLGLVLQKAAANGYNLHFSNVTVRGSVLMPGQEMIPVSMVIVDANSKAPEEVRIRALSTAPPADL